MRRAPFILACTVALAAAACSGSSDVAQPTRTLPAPGSALIEPVTSSTTEAPPPCPQNPITVDAGKPEVTVPEGDPPTELQTTDLVVGDGAEAAAGDTVAMQYVGVSYSTGEEFDSSWSRNADPFTFTLGNGEVIQGWDQGIVGMKVGGRRELIIPPDLGYGEAGSPPAIGPNETLVFVVDLVEVCTTDTAADATTGTDVPADGSTTGTEVVTGSVPE